MDQSAFKNLVDIFQLKLYFDIDFVAWLLWLWWPFILVTFILPTIIVILLYISACIVHIYRLRHYLKITDLLSSNNDDRARAAISLLWECHGWIWHGYEVCGLENLPKEGPALVVYYHGAIPVDYYYLNSRFWIYSKRLMRTIAAQFLFKTPGLRILMDVIKATPGTVKQVSEYLLEGEIISVAPGGIREAQFSNEYYELVWNNRVGFAKAAILGKAPIIPVFTQNIREAYRTAPFFRGTFRWIYEKTRLPLLPIYGGFPVKLKTIIGKPILYDPRASPEEIAIRTSDAIKRLIEENQRLPGSVVGALLQRFNIYDNTHRLLQDCHDNEN